MEKKDNSLKAFVKALRRSYRASLSGRKSAERRTFSQSPDLRPFTPAERAGRES